MRYSPLSLAETTQMIWRTRSSTLLARFAFIAQWHERALGMGEAPGSIPGEGSTVVGDHPLRERSAEPSDPVPSPMRGAARQLVESRGL